MASRVIGRLPVVYYPQTGRLEVENAGEFVEKQIRIVSYMAGMEEDRKSTRLNSSHPK